MLFSFPLLVRLPAEARARVIDLVSSVCSDAVLIVTSGSPSRRKDESKEPIVEVRTEDECTANHNAAGPTEPNETTPLTEPE